MTPNPWMAECYRLNIYGPNLPPQNSYLEILITTGNILRGGAL